MNNNPKSQAEIFNSDCTCLTLDKDQLSEQVGQLFDEITQQRPNLFSATTVFMTPKELEEIGKIIFAIEDIVKMPSYQKLVFERVAVYPPKNPGPLGVFMGYDFHLTEKGPKLIEINTNAGGALLNLELARAQTSCCQSKNLFFNEKLSLANLDETFFQMFLNEWQRQHKDSRKLHFVAIVDDDPQNQYLYPEFKLFERLFTKFGLKAKIADPKELLFKDGNLTLGGEVVDMIYNRLTDFYLEEENHASIKRAYDCGAIVLTPAPYHHAMYANKLNLITLTDPFILESLNIPKPHIDTLQQGIPKTQILTTQKADELWSNRKHLFFKPTSGFGGKATYRGDKITHRVWDDILKGEYVAQNLTPPTERLISIDGKQVELKMDIRAYVYQGEIQLLAARLYSGQTTNFRTPGGGFAPVYVVE